MAEAENAVREHTHRLALARVEGSEPAAPPVRNPVRDRGTAAADPRLSRRRAAADRPARAAAAGGPAARFRLPGGAHHLRPGAAQRGEPRGRRPGRPDRPGAPDRFAGSMAAHGPAVGRALPGPGRPRGAGGAGPSGHSRPGRTAARTRAAGRAGGPVRRGRPCRRVLGRGQRRLAGCGRVCRWRGPGRGTAAGPGVCRREQRPSHGPGRGQPLSPRSGPRPQRGPEQALQALALFQAATADVRFAQRRLQAATEAVRENTLRLAMAGDQLELLQQSRFARYQAAMGLVEAQLRSWHQQIALLGVTYEQVSQHRGPARMSPGPEARSQRPAIRLVGACTACTSGRPRPCAGPPRQRSPFLAERVRPASAACSSSTGGNRGTGRAIGPAGAGGLAGRAPRPGAAGGAAARRAAVAAAGRAAQVGGDHPALTGLPCRPAPGHRTAPAERPVDGDRCGGRVAGHGAGGA